MKKQLIFYLSYFLFLVLYLIEINKINSFNMPLKIEIIYSVSLIMLTIVSVFAFSHIINLFLSLKYDNIHFNIIFQIVILLNTLYQVGILIINDIYNIPFYSLYVMMLISTYRLYKSQRM